MAYACFGFVADTTLNRDRTINASSGSRSECRCVSAEHLGFWSVALPDCRRNDSNKISQREKDHMDNAPAISISVDRIWTVGLCQSNHSTRAVKQNASIPSENHFVE
jgi:hypothetical protein